MNNRYILVYNQHFNTYQIYDDIEGKMSDAYSQFELNMLFVEGMCKYKYYSLAECSFIASAYTVEELKLKVPHLFL